MDTNFSYVNIVTKGCEGWLNLFFGEYCVALVDNVEIADMIRQEIPKKKSLLDETNDHDNYWGEDGRCIHCGAGDDNHHSYTCPTGLHPDRRE